MVKNKSLERVAKMVRKGREKEVGEKVRRRGE
jgi:hypothetical protein